MACDVPLPRMNRSATTAPGFSRSIVEPGTRSDRTCVAGAITSTERAKLPWLANAGTESSSVFSVPFGVGGARRR